MPDLEGFRRETRGWLEANAPHSVFGVRGSDFEGSWGGRKAVYANPDMKVWLDVMAQKGWTAPSWPTQYGGGGLDKAEAKILAQEMKSLQLPPPLIGMGLTMIGPTLLRFGSEEQKLWHLPKICRGEIRWCQGYSEPGSGSDLASLQTRALRDGDEFVINGTKVWTSYAEQADWIFALVRSDPDAPKKQEGISFILIDMDDPGVSVSPILLISGRSPFCETHFTNVRVPVGNVIHEIGAGWTVAKALLGHERTMIADAFGTTSPKPTKDSKRSFLSGLAIEHLGETQGRAADPLVRDEVASIEMDSRAFGLTVQRTKDAARAGHQPGSESSMFKIYGSELNQRRYALMVRILGPQALGWEGPGFEADELDTTREWLRSRGNSIEGGTSEVQLNIIAKRVLGLPD
ncbi:MAG: acyl-CoA dehydrogenase family protein [Deltaproteobacteria bacterium]|nr:acyl-CoA dehydrogenase family protein [Deltaproteobacteria bacterium]